METKMRQTITEGSAKIKVEKTEKISSEMEVFYNPSMKLNRDIAVLFLNAIPEKNLRIALPLEASGIRGIRFIKELPEEKIESIEMNDRSKDAFESMKQTLKLNKITSDKIMLHNKDANIFLLSSRKFHYIDIDPFGTPNPFLDSAVKALRNYGYLAVTATDTAALAGTSRNACIRKYWAVPRRDSNMHETAVRILIRKIQLIGAQYHIALMPLLSYHHLHSYRIYLKANISKEKTGEILSLHGIDKDSGPMWLGKLSDKDLLEKIISSENTDEKLKKFIEIILAETKIGTIGFYDIHEFCEKNKINPIPKFENIMNKIKSLGHEASRTHFCLTGIKSDISEEELLGILKTTITKILN